MSTVLRAVRYLACLASITLWPAIAGDLNVLWYTAGTTDGGNFSSYENGVLDLTSYASTSPGGSSWNITFWESGSMPTGNFNTLVIASPQFIDGADYSALNAVFPTLGNRVAVTGLDADWHYMNSPGPTNFDGPRGFLSNLINWSASGSGMGAVFLAPQANIAWNFGGLGNEVSYENLDNIALAAGTESYAIQSSLSSAGLSNWSTSAKEAWDSFDTSQWTALQVIADDSSRGVTLVSNQSALGGLVVTSGESAPEPASLLMVLTGVLAICALRRKRIHR